jgi:hypothetical protein
MALLSAAVACTADDSFPPLVGESLAGGELTLPPADAGGAAIVIATFEEDAGKVAAEWRRRIETELVPDPGPRVFGVAFLDSMPGFVKSMVVSGIRRGVPKAQHGTFLVVSTDDPQWKRHFGYRARDVAYVLLLDGGGAIRWRGHGEVDDGDLAALREAIAGLER